MKSFEHLTITTGASRMSQRSEVGDHVVDNIRTALANDKGRLPHRWRVEMLPTPEGGHVFDLWLGKTRVVRCWLCEDAAAADLLWSGASVSGLDPHAVVRRPAHTPWLAAALTTDAMMLAMTEPEALAEAGDLERCVAWALLE